MCYSKSHVFISIQIAASIIDLIHIRIPVNTSVKSPLRVNTEKRHKYMLSSMYKCSLNQLTFKSFMKNLSTRYDCGQTDGQAEMHMPPAQFAYKIETLIQLLHNITVPITLQISCLYFFKNIHTLWKYSNMAILICHIKSYESCLIAQYEVYGHRCLQIFTHSVDQAAGWTHKIITNYWFSIGHCYTK